MIGWRTLALSGLVGLAAAVLVFAPVPVSLAGISSTAHDFDGFGFVDRGACSACHDAHNGGDPQKMWPRDLTDERTEFDQGNTTIETPNYIRGGTILCYDCHDNQNAADVDEDPPRTSWGNSIHGGPDGYPQDIAYDDYPGGQGTGEVGYYELEDGSLPSGASGGGPTDGSPTGGHFWQSAPDNGGSPEYEQGDKLDCSVCHDPHSRVTGTNDVMFRTSTSDGMGGTIDLGDGRNASVNTRARAGQDAQINNGRNMCAACHRYSDEPNAAGATANGIPTTTVDMWNVPLPQPPDTISVHAYDANSTVACTECHKHNRIFFSCEECHGFPPVNTSVFDSVTNPGGYSAGYPNGAQGALAHQRHLDVLGADFRCEMCHGPDPGAAAWHGTGGRNVSQDQVDIMGESAVWNPDSTRTTEYTGTGTASGPAGYEFSRKGGPDQRCSGLACHGDPPDTPGALNWSDDMVDETTGNFNAGGRDVCVWCHDETPSVINVSTVYTAPNTMGDGTNFGFDVSGHGLSPASNYDQAAIGDAAGLSGAGLDCDLCHDATYSAGVPARTHFGAGTDNRDEMRLRDTIDSYAIGAATGPDDACEACHQNASPGPNAGGMISHHGNDYATPLEAPFERNCRQCHELHGSNWNGDVGTGRNLHMVGKWLDTSNPGTADGGERSYVDSNATDAIADITTADNWVVFTSFTGANSFDENDGPAPDDAADNADDICGTCHIHPGTGGGDHNGAPSFGGDMRGTDCMQCHDHDYDDDYTTADAFAPSGCEGCHNLNAYDPDGGGPLPAAPNVMGDGTNPLGLGSTPKVYDDGTWGFNVNGHGANGTAPNNAEENPPFDDLSADAACTDCHDISDPPGTHNDGTLNSAELGTNTNTNTAHLRAEFFADTAIGSGAWEEQVDFDNACYVMCHIPSSVNDMRHEQDTLVSDPHHWSVEFGTHLSVPDGSVLPYPVDIDITTTAPAGAPHYATCVSCHNPHGTNVVESSRNWNLMMRDPWITPSTLCRVCHPG